MPDSTDGKKIFTLLEVSASIQKTLSMRYTSSFWVKAEMNKLNHYPHSGHCYPDLVEKQDGRVIAQLKATLWKDDYNRINNRFLSVLKAPLNEGIKMLFCARITFDAVHGLALRITDIDPVFSLGELEREKQESIARLKSEGIFQRNRSMHFPVLPQRLAVISVQTSKGYADFNKIIQGNPWGYAFFQVLFPSLLQGEKAIDSILYQLDRIRKVAEHFDVVAIIRGGGGEVGLSCFNDYRLAKEIALFPLPVITGIGHATNETVAEMVAYRNAITPTELADFLLQKFHDFSVPVRKAEEMLMARTRRLIAEHRQRLHHSVKFFRSVTNNVLDRSHHEMISRERDLFRQANLATMREKQAQSAILYKLSSASTAMCGNRYREVFHWASELRRSSVSLMKQENVRIANTARTIENLHPVNVLKRGYSITRVNGKAVSSVEEVRSSDVIQTIVADGAIISEVQQVKKSPEI